MADERPTTPEGAPGTPDEEPTRVVEPAPGSGSAAGTPPAPGPADAAGIEDIDVPAGGRVTEDTTAAPGGGPDAAAVTGGAPRATGPVPPDPAAGATPGPGAGGPGTEDADGGRRARAKERTAEGAKIAADRVSQAASATARALRETDVREIAHSTTDIIQTTRPFFLAAFAAVFAFLGAVENHASIGVVFAAGAILCVLAAAFSTDLGGAVGRRRDRRP